MASFKVNHHLLAQAKETLANHPHLYWFVGGAGAGKTTLCQALSTRHNIPIYDMDAHIYGTYHSRFTAAQHPTNHAWAAAPNGLAWLLNMSWPEFNAFNQAVIPEYLHLLMQDLTAAPDQPILIDGGICNPALLAQALPANQIICLSRPGRTSHEIWAENEERQAMQSFITALPNSNEAWQQFLDFDQKITQTILQECKQNHITVYSRDETESVDHLAARIPLIFAKKEGNND